MNQSRKSRIISLTMIGLSILLVVLIAFSNSELTSAWGALQSMHKGYLALCALCLAGYVTAEGLGLYLCLRARGYRIALPSAIHLSLQGLYYANITPGSSGGQPMQAYLMSQRSIPVGVGASALSVRFFFNQLVMVGMTGVLWLCNAAFCQAQLGRVKMLIILGCAINFAAVPLVLLAMFRREWLDRLAALLLRLGTRLRLVKQPEVLNERIRRILDSYHDSMVGVARRPGQLLTQLLVSLAEMLCLTSVTVCVYRAFGQAGTAWYELLAVSIMLFVSASYTPLPGASGAQEGGFLLYYRGIFAGGTISVALLVWRFMTYYAILLIGAGDALISSFRKKYRQVEAECDAD